MHNKKVVTFIALWDSKISGIPRVVREVIKRMKNYEQYFLIYWIYLPAYSVLKEAFKIKNLKKIPLFFKKQIQYLKILLSSDFVVILSSPTVFGNLLLLILGFIKIVKKIKIIQFIPDLIPCVCPETVRLATKIDFKFYGLFLKNIPDKFVANSKNTKNDLMKIWKIPEKKIKVAYHGSFIKVQNPRTNFENKKILFVSTIEPRKNLERLIEAFLKVQKKIPEAELIIVGKIGWKVKKLMRKINKLVKENKQIKYLGYLPDEKLIELYKSVDLFVYPSLYEGFGLPPLEAMACGCPVIVSRTSSLPEVVEDAGVFINPYETEDIVNKILEILPNKELKIQLSKMGVEQAKKFSWDNFVEELAKEFL